MKKLTMAAVLGLLAPLATTAAIADSSPAVLDAMDATHVQSLDSAEETRGKSFPIYRGSDWISNFINYFTAYSLAEEWCSGRTADYGCTGSRRIESSPYGPNPGTPFLMVQYRAHSVPDVYQYQWAKY